MKKYLSFYAVAIVCCGWLHQSLYAQCTYSTTNAPASSNCVGAYDITPYIDGSLCETVCISTGNSATCHNSNDCSTSCTNGTNDAWLKLVINNTDNFANKTLAFSFKSYPGNSSPIAALYAEAAGDATVFLGPIPIAFTLEVNCQAPPDHPIVSGFLPNAFLLSGEAVCIDVTGAGCPPSPEVPSLPCFDQNAGNGDQIYMNQDFLITTAEIETFLADAIASVNGTASIDQIAIYIQLQTDTPGDICFEVSSYAAGAICGDANVLTYDPIANPVSETQSINDCLCNTALNGGLSTISSTPSNYCIGTDGTKESAVWFAVNAGYTCNQITATLTNWAGSGNVNVAIVGDMNCLPITDPNLSIGLLDGVALPPPPGAIVDSYTELASGCLASGQSISTNGGNCLNGTYWVVVEGVDDRSDFSLDITITASITTPGVVAQLTAVLEGAYNGGVMNTQLRNDDLLPPAQPYNRPPWGYLGTESFASVGDMPTNMTDWVLIEMRSEGDIAQIVASKAAVLLENGSIVDHDGVTNGINFPTLIDGNSYYVVVRHRNHLAVISAAPVQVQSGVLTYDFTTSSTQALGTEQQKEVAVGVFALHAGDFDSNGTITVADFNLYSSQTALLNVYVDGDANLDKNVTVADFNLYQPNSSKIGAAEIRY